VFDIRPDLVEIQRLDVVADVDPLRELPEPVFGQDLSQFGLAHQDHLHELALRRLQVCQQPHLLEKPVGKRLGLVDDQHDPLPAGIALDQEVVQKDEQLALRRPAIRLQAQVLADELQEVRCRKPRVVKVRRARVAVDPCQHRLDEGGLSRAGLASDDGKALRFTDGIHQVGVGRAVLIAHVEEPRVGTDVKRVFRKAVVFLVHNLFSARDH